MGDDASQTVRIIATGGTIASHLTNGVWESLPGSVLVRELGDLPVPVDVVDVAAGSSSNLSVDDMRMIIGHVASAISGGVRGVVVTHGTDTLELTAFLCALLVDTSKCAVVFTGAMRPHSGVDIDGPQNLRDAIALASSPATRDRGVVAVLDGKVHSPRHIRKVNAAAIDAFTSDPFAPLAVIDDGDAHWSTSTSHMAGALPVVGNIEHRVPLVVAYPGMDPSVLDAACAGSKGVVLEAFGDLNSPHNLWPTVRRAADDGVLVAVTSNSFTPTVRNEGLELLGARGMGGLTSQKSRLALMCALGDGRSRDEANAYIDTVIGGNE